MKALTIQNDDLQNTLNTLDCGVVKIIFDGEGKRHIQWANEGFFRLSGYGREGYAQEMNENPHKLLHPDDMGWVFKAFNEHVHTKSPLTIEYRIVHKDGYPVWLYVKSNFVGMENGFPVFICVMIDVTEQRRLNETLKREEQRYSLVNSFSNDILFEYDTSKDYLTLFGKAESLIGRRYIKNFKTSLQSDGLVHADDIEHGLEIANCDPTLTGVRRSDKFRIKYSSCGYQWCYCLYDTIAGSNENECIVLGKLVNVHEATVQIQELERKSSFDSMTNVYNKATVEALIAGTLAGGGEHALLIIDVDDFKEANDSYGHAWGDKVITRIAETVKNSFRTSDIVGRIGGDEFVVLLCGSASATFVQRNIERYLAALHAIVDEVHPEFRFSTSVGVGLFPQHACTYQELFLAADAALYTVKKQNKGSFWIESPRAGILAGLY